MYDSVRGKMARIDCIKVNADYESVLFHGKNGPPAMNQALEFLAFYLQDLPVLTTLDYPARYLEKISSLSGKNPLVTKSGKPRNWWGPLENPELERWMNSKLTSFRLALAEGWTEGGIHSREELTSFHPQIPYLVKDPFNMSGKGIIPVHPEKELVLPASLSGELIVEPHLDRKHDFSHFVFPDGRMICYENLVDERFQYRGTLFSDLENFTHNSLSFHDKVSPQKWEEFSERLEVIRKHYGDPSPYGFSVDSFLFEKNGELVIHPLCEVNARRTMGLVAYELVQIMGRGKRAALTLKKPLFEDAILLSPDGAKFEIYLSFN